MKNILLIAILSSLFVITRYQSNGQQLVPQWALQVGGPGDERGVKVITDPGGNIYFSGIIEKEVYISFNGITDTIVSYGKEDIYFGKINAIGQWLWAKHIGGKGADSPTDMTISGSGDVYLSGIFEDTLVIDTDSIVSQDYIDSFVAKYDSLGNLNWLRRIAGFGNQQCVSLLSDLDGNLLTAGYFTNTLEFSQANSESFLSQGGYDGFLAKWTPQGDLNWINLIQGTGETLIKDVLIDNFNDYYIIGDFTDSLTVDSSQSSIYSVGNTDAFIVKYDNDGQFSWIRSVGSVYDDKAKCLTLGGNGKMIIMGEFKENLIYDNEIIMSATGGDDIFQITINKHGKLQHQKKHGLEKNDFVFDAWIPVGQKILMASDLRINEGNQNTILATYEMLGDLADIYQIGNDFNPTILSAVMPDLDHIYFCGNFNGTVTFDQLTLVSNGQEDLFLMKMAPENVMLNAFQPDSADTEYLSFQTSDYKVFGNDNIFMDSLKTEYGNEQFYNYPNPFLKKTQIIYNLPETCNVIIKIIDVNGNVLKEWQFLNQSAGNYCLDFDREKFSNGIYHCKLIAKGKSVFISKVIKMICVN